MTVKTISALPTWLAITGITKLGILPKKHPYHGRVVALSRWADNRTPLCELFDFALWAIVVILTAMILVMTLG